MKIEEFAQLIGRRLVRETPEGTTVAYEGVIATPAENGVNDPERVKLILYSDNTAMDADEAPYEPTNPKDPVSPQKTSVDPNSIPYPDGVLQAFPDDPNIFPEAPPDGGGGENGGGEDEDLTGTITGFTMANPTEVTTDLEDQEALTVGGFITLEALEGDEAAKAIIDGARVEVLSVGPTTLDMDLTMVDVTGLTADYTREAAP